MSQNKAWNKITYLVAVAIFCVCFFLFRSLSGVDVFLKGIDQKYSGFEVNIFAAIAALAVEAIVYLLYKLYYLFYEHYWKPTKLVEGAIKKIERLLLRATPQWGATINSDTTKIANTAEALFYPSLFFKNLTPVSSDVFKKGIDSIINNAELGGLKSNTYGKFTVQCTSLGLFVLEILYDNGIANSELKNAKDKLRHALLNSISEYGWSTLAERNNDRQHIRITTSLWALRSINKSSSEPFPANAANVINSLLSTQPDGKFGFNINDSPKITSICLFLILIYELKDANIKASILQSISISELLRAPKKALNSGFFVEIEDYSTKNISGMQIEKLPFTHVASIYVLTALMCYVDELSMPERINLRIVAHKKINEFMKNEDSGFEMSGLQQTPNNPLIYPMTYFLEFLSHYKRTYGL